MGDHMFKDLTLSRDLMASHRGFKDDGGGKQTVMVLQRSFWPFSARKQDIVLPVEASPPAPSPTPGGGLTPRRCKRSSTRTTRSTRRSSRAASSSSTCACPAAPRSAPRLTAAPLALARHGDAAHALPGPEGEGDQREPVPGRDSPPLQRRGRAPVRGHQGCHAHGCTTPLFPSRFVRALTGLQRTASSGGRCRASRWARSACSGSARRARTSSTPTCSSTRPTSPTRTRACTSRRSRRRRRCACLLRPTLPHPR
jgi:hypothetical protein